MKVKTKIYINLLNTGFEPVSLLRRSVHRGELVPITNSDVPKGIGRPPSSRYSVRHSASRPRFNKAGGTCGGPDA